MWGMLLCDFGRETGWRSAANHIAVVMQLTGVSTETYVLPKISG